MASDRYLEDGSFLKLREITLGYTLPVDWGEAFEAEIFAHICYGAEPADMDQVFGNGSRGELHAFA